MAFEQLFGLRRGEFEQNFSKNSNARGVALGGCLSFDLTGTLFKCESERKYIGWKIIEIKTKYITGEVYID